MTLIFVVDSGGRGGGGVTNQKSFFLLEEEEGLLSTNLVYCYLSNQYPDLTGV